MNEKLNDCLEITDLKDMLNKTRSLYANKIVTRKWIRVINRKVRSWSNFLFKKIWRNIKKIKMQGIGKLKHLISMDLEEHQDGIYSEKELIKTGRELITDYKILNLSF